MESVEDDDKEFKTLDGTSNTTPPEGDEEGHDIEYDEDEASSDDSEYDSNDDFDDFSVESYSLSSIDTGASIESSSVVTGITTEEPESSDTFKKPGVRWGRFSAMTALVISLGVLLPFTLYRVAEKFEESWSEDVGSALQDNLRKAFMALDAIALDLWLAADDSWPQVSFSDFPIWSTQTQLLSPAIQSTVFAPLVSEEERSSYEEYVSSRSDVRRLQKTEVQGRIYEIAEEKSIVAPGPGPYVPIRQLHPVVEGSANYNLKSNVYLTKELQQSSKTATAILGTLLEDDGESSILKDLLLLSSAADSAAYGVLVYPIRGSMGIGGASGRAVGSIVALISWADMFPSSNEDLVAVLRNSCGQVASFHLQGSVVDFLGFFDGHDRQYSSDRHTYDLQNLQLEQYTISQIPLSDNPSTVCQYSLDLYPFTDDESMDPMLFVGIALGFFVWTCLIFLIYDYFLERRNKATLTSAMEARAIISSLFPATVRDRLFETKRVQRKEKKKKLKKLKKKMKELRKRRKKKEQEDSKADSPRTPEGPSPATLSPRAVQNLLDSVPALGTSMRNIDAVIKNKGQNFVMHPKHQLKNFLANTSSAFELSEELSLNKPIADLFPHTTVLFADIVGFTAWSSERAPEDVFVLLQTIYHAFDKIAKRRGVFKVETIGDCYVAVTGLPDPQPDHALRLTKFARECMTKMMEVTKRLEVSLGPDTGDLCLRLGLNSGPVTAGVLQGEKSRFQLFGDTVNTASRMESTGEMNRVHLSKSTADLLIEAGKGYWVKPRTDLVHAKGKGNVQTFWLVSRTDNYTFQTNRSTDELDAEIKRVAPSRSRSTFATGEPVRGVKRTTSDSVTKLDKLSDMVTQGREGNDMREERLVQWQLELFTRLLKKIIAARDDAPGLNKLASNDGWEGITRGNHTVAPVSSFDISLNGCSEHSTSATFNNHAHTVIDRFSHQEILGTTPERMPKRDTSFRVPQRRLSTHTAGSFDVSISTFHSSNGELSLLKNEEEDIEKIVVDEVAEVITLPKFTARSIKVLEKAETIVLEEAVISQLKDYISTIASMYRKNPFHNFEHARYVYAFRMTVRPSSNSSLTFPHLATTSIAMSPCRPINCSIALSFRSTLTTKGNPMILLLIYMITHMA